jgi:hypothetical protein
MSAEQLKIAQNISFSLTGFKVPSYASSLKFELMTTSTYFESSTVSISGDPKFNVRHLGILTASKYFRLTKKNLINQALFIMKVHVLLFKINKPPITNIQFVIKITIGDITGDPVM